MSLAEFEAVLKAVRSNPNAFQRTLINGKTKIDWRRIAVTEFKLSFFGSEHVFQPLPYLSKIYAGMLQALLEQGKL